MKHLNVSLALAAEHGSSHIARTDIAQHDERHNQHVHIRNVSQLVPRRVASTTFRCGQGPCFELGDVGKVLGDILVG